MIIMHYVGSIAKDYRDKDNVEFKIVKRDGITDRDGNYIYNFRPTDNYYRLQYLDLSQSIAAIIPYKDNKNNYSDFLIYYVDNNNYINYLRLYDYDDVNNDWKIENIKLEIIAIRNEPLSYWKDDDFVQWIYFESLTKTKAVCRLNVKTNRAEYITDIDYGDIAEYSMKTGYGIIDVSKKDMNTFIWKSFIKDQIVEVPNNFYVNALAVKLAMAYRIKQNSDTTILSQQYSDMIADHYNSNNIDSWTPVRISNMY